MYPWQSGSDGSEVSQQLHLNPRSGRWTPDPSDRAHHVGLAVAYNAWHYYQVTGDRQYLVDCGAELLVEIARFWVGLAKLDDSRGRYLIRGVIGPDEFHSGYPGNEYDGIDNNAYTNVMAVWVILRAMEALDLLPLTDRRHLIEKLGLTTQERDQWDDVSRRMFVPFHDGVISQFEGYSELAELDWDHYRHRYGNIQRLDRILEAEGDSVNNYQASKQADALMLLYLLSSDELIGLLARQLPLRAHTNPRHRGLLSCPHLGWIYPERCRACVGSRPRQPEQCHGVLPSGPALRYRRRPGRHNPGRNSPGGHGWQHRPAAALLFRIGTARRPAGVEPAMAGSTWTT